MDPSAESVRQSIEDRLKDITPSPGQLPRVRRRFATKVLLERLAHKTDFWTLKGAFLLETRLEEAGVQVSSMTRDVDIATNISERFLMELIEIAGTSLLDPFEIRIQTPSKSKPSPKTERRTIELRLAGRVFEQFQIDIAEQKVLAPHEPFLIDKQPLDSHDVTIKAQTVGGALLDKLSAFSQIHAGGRRSSRSRDLPDMLHLIDLAGESAAKLVAEALYQTDLELPKAFPSLPDDWPVKLKDRSGKTLNTFQIHSQLEMFWNPILREIW